MATFSETAAHCSLGILTICYNNYFQLDKFIWYWMLEVGDGLESKYPLIVFFALSFLRYITCVSILSSGKLLLVYYPDYAMPNSKESTFWLTSNFAFLTRIKTTVSLVTSSQSLRNTSHQLHFFSKSFINSAASAEHRLKSMGVCVHLLWLIMKRF